MKTSCNILKTVIVVLIISIILTIFFYYNNSNDFEKLLLNISIGIIGSSLVSLFMSISSYLTEKKKTLYNYYQTFYRKIIDIDCIEYYDSEIDEDLFIKYLQERINNDNFSKIGLKKQKHEYKERIIEELKNKNKYLLKYMNEKELVNNISKNLEEWTADEIKKIEEILKKYQEVARIPIYDLKSILGDISFLFGNNTLKYINNELHGPLCDFMGRIKHFDYHISLYLNGKGNLAAVTQMLFELQNNYLFSIEEKEVENNKVINVYYKWQYNIMNKLELLRAKIFSDKVEKEEPILILSKSYSNDEK